MKIIVHFNNKIKSYLKKIKLLTKGEVSYEEFEKLESKKYPHQSPTADADFKSHHPYHCTNDCFRKR